MTIPLRVRFCLSPLLLSLVTLSTVSAETAYTDPMGGMVIPIKGNRQTTIISCGGFTQPPIFVGEGDVVSATQFVDPDAAWTENEFVGDHYVQLSTGDWAPILGNTATSLTLGANLTVGTDFGFKILPFHTLAKLFGPNNEAGFTPRINLGVSDFLIQWDNEGQTLGGAYYFNSDNGRWEDSFGDYAADVIIYPDESMIVIGESDGSIVLSGHVQIGATSGFVAGGGATTILPNPYPVDVKISTSGLENTLWGGPNLGLADAIFVFSPATQLISKAYYFDTNDQQWNDSFGDEVTDDDVIPAGSGVIILKKSANDANWFLSQPF